MGFVVQGPDSLRKLFSATVENTFHAELGVVDPALIDYVVDLLIRFVRLEALFRIRDPSGLRLEEVADMILEAENRQSRPQREVYRHIGDFTLFWSGIYPEALTRLQAAGCKDHLIDYCRQGKRSYYIASTFEEEPFEQEAPVLRRLSDDFELICFGLNRVRREWNQRPQPPQPWNAEQN